MGNPCRRRRDANLGRVEAILCEAGHEAERLMKVTLMKVIMLPAGRWTDLDGQSMRGFHIIRAPAVAVDALKATIARGGGVVVENPVGVALLPAVERDSFGAEMAVVFDPGELAL
jgi:hypothetical protein